MAIGVYFASTGMTSEVYDQAVARLESAGAGSPQGRIHHASFGDPANLQVFDIWNSQADFDAFGATLMPILTELGANMAPPEIMEIHNIMP